jgi:hypothetical protein
MYVEVFPNHNIGVIENAKRISWKSLPLLIEHIKNDMRVPQTAFILFSTFLDLKPASDASD